MKNKLKISNYLMMLKQIFGACLVLILLLVGEAEAGQLTDRLAKFPHWTSKPPVSTPVSDLIYPDWMEGTWTITSTLIEQVAPFTPEVVTPGFESNRRYLNKPIRFQVRFQRLSSPSSVVRDSFLPLKAPDLKQFEGKVTRRWVRSPTERSMG